MKPIRIAVVGLGKIARDEHLPAIAASDRFVLAATVDPVTAGIAAVPHFRDFAELIDAGLELDAVALCMPPKYRFDVAFLALMHEWHVLLEKPPCATFDEADRLRILADTMEVTLFAAWHSRFAPGVEPARQWLAQRQAKSVRAIWHEDVRVWHPGQDWIWKKEGFGVYDPGINAVSILTRILPLPFRLAKAIQFVPANWQAPIAANLCFRDSNDSEIILDLDWTRTGTACWDIEVETDLGSLRLTEGGANLSLPDNSDQPGHADQRALSGEYPAIYEHFAALIEAGRGDDDLTPLAHVMDAFDSAEQRFVEPFHF